MKKINSIEILILVEALGGKALPCIVDVREEKQIQKAVDEAVKKVQISKY